MLARVGSQAVGEAGRSYRARIEVSRFGERALERQGSESMDLVVAQSGPRGGERGRPQSAAPRLGSDAQRKCARLKFVVWCVVHLQPGERHRRVAAIDRERRAEQHALRLQARMGVDSSGSARGFQRPPGLGGLAGGERLACTPQPPLVPSPRTTGGQFFVSGCKQAPGKIALADQREQLQAALGDRLDQL